MLKRVLLYLLVIGGLGVLYISTSYDVMEQITLLRSDTDSWWGVHDSNDKGDLVHMAYMDYVRKFNSKRDYVFHKPDYTGPKEVDLYLHGDSYTFKIPDSAFAGINKYNFGYSHSKHTGYNPDTTKVNVLILEHAERFVRTLYSDLTILNLVYHYTRGSRHDSITAALKPAAHAPVATYYDHAGTLLDRALRDFFNKNINQNLEYNLFNYNFMNAPRLAKGWFNYRFFKRASGNVVISDDGNHLFIKETISETQNESYCSEITDKEYRNMVTNMNILYDYYRAEGFDEVYLAIIPNPITILQPDRYNMLIPKLQNDTALKMKCIDIYTPFKKAGSAVYRPGDTHWNNRGLQMWIGIVNDTLEKWNTPRLVDSVPVIPPAQ